MSEVVAQAASKPLSVVSHGRKTERLGVAAAGKRTDDAQADTNVKHHHGEQEHLRARVFVAATDSGEGRLRDARRERGPLGASSAAAAARGTASESLTKEFRRFPLCRMSPLTASPPIARVVTAKAGPPSARRAGRGQNSDCRGCSLTAAN